ncbi:MAG: hypothetical protein HeimC3_20940 [Candidatus Heimdallarchaeota archaeon LC_3]|nr:MAG: hypothetical protein HeimC3_20940 [Candidatus Heimdallarchaeota archaeon LC_3]
MINNSSSKNQLNNIKSENLKNIYSGKIGVLGNHTSGKTRTIKSLINLASKKIIFTWNEDEEFTGTASTVPFTISWKFSDQKLIIVDNPGQNSYQQIRNYVAKSGENYNSFLIFIDAISWNFSKIAFLQAQSILNETKISCIPSTVVITKLDLLEKLVNDEMIDVIARQLVKSLNKLKSNARIHFYNRSLKKMEWVIHKVNNHYISFSHLEQIFINSIEELLMINPIEGLTKSNIRILIRSLLFGYCELLQSWISLPEYKNRYSKVQIPEQIDLFLSNYRGSVLESGSQWEKQTKKPDIVEINFPIELFDFTRILDVFKRYSFLSINEEQASKEIFQLGSKILPLCEFSKSFFINNNNRKSLSMLEEELRLHLENIQVQYKFPEKKSKFSQFKELPPKPKPRDFS